MGAVKSPLMMLRPLTLTLLILQDLILCPAKSPESGGALSEFIRHYEPLNYDTEAVHRHHHRVKRSLKQQLKIDFSAHNRDFRLRLERDTSVYHPELIVENSHRRLHHDRSNAYTGHLQGEPGSRVHGVILRDGRFEGKVTTADDIFVIERTERHFSDPQHFHSVIYRHSDVKMDNLDTSALCKGQAVYEKLQNGTKNQNTNQNSSQNVNNNQYTNGSRSIYTNQHPRSHRSLHRRHTRSTIDPAKQMCALYLQADHLFYQKFHGNEETVIEQLTQHVQGVNEIYKTIDFDDDGYADNINFIIKRIKVHTDPNSPGYKFPSNYGVETFLELFSEDNFDAFCLAYMFTYRDFEGGTLGLAWTGDLQNAGGVCEKNGQFRGSLKSLNSGIVTILNYGKDVPSTVSHVTMAHEFGHNMGSQHDPETTECSPGGERGNYIMFARATSGDKPNNNRFSHCSKNSMAKVMAAKARHKEGCFIPPTSSICGNGVVEAGEQCDCGWEDECLEQCCYPQTSSDFASMLGNEPCTRRERAVCSPSEGPCCSASCQLIPLFHNKTCRQATSCKDAAICDGSSAECPASHQRPDKTLCDREFVCYHGECTGSICLAYELESCQCAPARPDDYKDTSLCELCCKLPGEGSPCLSASEWDTPPYNVPKLKAKPGTPCNDYKGYCDVFQRCRELIFSEEGVETLKEWLNTYWYVVLVVALSFVIFLAILVRLCTPKKTVIKVITAAGLDGMTHSVQQVMSYPVTTPTSSSSSPLKSVGGQWVARRLMPPTATGTIPSTKPLPSCSKLPFKMPLGSHSSALQRSSHPDLISKVPMSRTNLPAMFRHRDGWV